MAAATSACLLTSTASLKKLQVTRRIRKSNGLVLDPTPTPHTHTLSQENVAAMREELAQKTTDLDAWESEKSRYQTQLVESHARILSVSQAMQNQLIPTRLANLNPTLTQNLTYKSTLAFTQSERQKRVSNST